MSRPWSKLQKEYYLLLAEGLNLQLHCRAYRMDSQRGGTNLPRYWITLGKEVIWDYPKDFVNKLHPKRTNIKWYPYGTDIPDMSSLIREYIDTPKTELFSIITRATIGDPTGMQHRRRISSSPCT